MLILASKVDLGVALMESGKIDQKAIWPLREQQGPALVALLRCNMPADPSERRALAQENSACLHALARLHSHDIEVQHSSITQNRTR